MIGETMEDTILAITYWDAYQSEDGKSYPELPNFMIELNDGIFVITCYPTGIRYWSHLCYEYRISAKKFKRSIEEGNRDWWKYRNARPSNLLELLIRTGATPAWINNKVEEERAKCIGQTDKVEKKQEVKVSLWRKIWKGLTPLRW